jgi:glycosyltransferase 2 family protein
VKKLERRVLLGLLFGMAVYLVMALWADVGAVKDAVLGFGWGWLVVALALTFGNYLLRFVKWQYYLGIVSVRVPRGESFTAFLASFVLTVTPGKVGEVVKSYLLKRSRGVPIAVTAPIVVAERLTDLLALLILAFVGLSTFAYGATALFVSAGVVLGGLLLLAHAPSMRALIDLTERLPWLGAKVAPKLRIAYRSMRALIGLRPLLLATVLSVAGWSLECVAFHLVIGGFDGARPELVAATFLYASSTVVGALSFLPGGLGVTEGGLSVGLVELGLLPTESLAVAATYLIRFATLWFAVLLGVLALGLFRRRYLRDEGPPAEDEPASLERQEVS